MANKGNTSQTGHTKILIIVVAVLLLAAVVIGVILLCRSCGSQPTVQAQEVPLVIGGGEPIPEEAPVEKNTTGIDLPGYGSITFKAGQKQQDFTIPNPAQNTCLVRMSLIMADGTVLWTSELVKPGYYCKPIELVAPMERGEYKNVVLKYECFTDDAEQRPLNGAQTGVTIIAK